jgi:hypothetical protein
VKRALLFATLAIATSSGAHPQIFSSGPVVTSIIGNWQHGARIIPSAGGKTLYGQFDSSADWVLSQWDNPVSDLGNFGSLTCSGGFAGYTNCWQATSPNITDTFGTDGSSVQWFDTVSAGGSTLPCTPSGVAELDNFLAANGPYPAYPHAIKANVNLGVAPNLYAKVSVNPVSFTVNSARCATTQSEVMLAITFTNASQHQTLFYQLHLVGYPIQQSATWFANNNPFGFRDELWDGYGLFQNGIPTGQVTAININVLPRITSIIQGATNGLDTNISDWQSGQINVGHNVWGDMQTESLWSAASLSTQ